MKFLNEVIKKKIYLIFWNILIVKYSKGDKVIYSDKDGTWGIEHGKLCGIWNSLVMYYNFHI